MKRPPELSQLASLFERWSNIETKRREASDDLKRIFADGKADGFNPKAMRVAFAEQYSLDNEDQATREKREKNSSEADLYLTALARVREGIDPTTGEILESIEPPATA